MKYTYLLILIVGLVISCRSGKNNIKIKTSKFDKELLYKVWDVESINAGGKLISGKAMGSPQYEFTNDGQRIKSFKTPPHSESINYEWRNDSIFYSGPKDLPAVAITQLTDSTLILSNEKAVWKLYTNKK